MKFENVSYLNTYLHRQMLPTQTLAEGEWGSLDPTPLAIPQLGS